MNCSQIFCTFAVETTRRWNTSYRRRLWIALKFFVLLQSKQLHFFNSSLNIGCELLSNFLYFCSRNNAKLKEYFADVVVNCSQIFCTFAVETTLRFRFCRTCLLWIALKFFVLLQSKQRNSSDWGVPGVVNCSQIFCTFAVETTNMLLTSISGRLWIALKFFVLLQSKQLTKTNVRLFHGCELLSNFLYFCSRNNSSWRAVNPTTVVNCSQIFCTFAVETTLSIQGRSPFGCELLSNFLYFCSRNNSYTFTCVRAEVVNCSQIFCTFAVETTFWANFIQLESCELLSNFLYFCSRNNVASCICSGAIVVNCSQIFCTFAVETTIVQIFKWSVELWIALKFFVLLQSKQRMSRQPVGQGCCELLSNFLYFCSRNNA